MQTISRTASEYKYVALPLWIFAVVPKPGYISSAALTTLFKLDWEEFGYAIFLNETAETLDFNLEGWALTIRCVFSTLWTNNSLTAHKCLTTSIVPMEGTPSPCQSSSMNYAYVYVINVRSGHPWFILRCQWNLHTGNVSIYSTMFFFHFWTNIRVG